MNYDKIAPAHLARKAIVYVRQSSADQVRHNRESQRRQYDLANQARMLGWHAVTVIDEDLGRSGATAVGRPGFARLVADVCLGEVGAVFSLEASRLARNNRDWYQLLDFCAMVETLIVDFDGVYDPRLLNDRLLLGLKGTMSEFELGLLRQRAHEAMRQMAERGELVTNLPIGYVRSADGRCERDPDLRIQQALHIVFEKFGAYGSVRQVLVWCRQEGVALPAAVYESQGRRVRWQLPTYSAVHRILTNPTYAGAYAYGRTETQQHLHHDRSVTTRSVRRPREAWKVLLLNHHEGYIPWDAYERNQQQIRENANMKGLATRGAARPGHSLLAGLLRCARCGHRLSVHYGGLNGSTVRYTCRNAAINQGTEWCISFGGLGLERAVEREVLRVVQPAAVEASLAAFAELEGQCDARHTAVELALRQAQYEADRARRQYDAIEPENRLVAAELERRWNTALLEVRRLEEQLRFLSTPTHAISTEERAALLALANDLPGVWNDPQTDMALRKRLVRTVIDEIIVDVDEERARVVLVIRWTGGAHTTLRVRKRRPGEHRYVTDREVVDIVRELAQVVPDRAIASILNRLGKKTGKGNTWTESRVQSLREVHGIPAHSTQTRETKSWVTMQEAAAALSISSMSIRRLIIRGTLPARQIVPKAPWLIEKAVLASPQVQSAVIAIKHRHASPLPANPDQERLGF